MSDKNNSTEIKTDVERTLDEMLIDEKFISTPDMGEYMDNNMIDEIAKKIADGGTKGEYFIEEPFSKNLGYHPTENVFIISGKPEFVSDNKYDTSKNTNDGDTVYLNFQNIIDGGQPFKLDGKTYNSVKDWIYTTHHMDNVNDDVAIRFLGINAPELPHVRDIPDSPNLKTIKLKIKDIVEQNKINVPGIGDVPTSEISWMKYDIGGKNGFGNLTSKDEEKEFVVITADNSDTDHKNKIQLKQIISKENNKIRICLAHDVDNTIWESGKTDYYEQGLNAQATVIEEIKNAQDILYMLDGTTLKKAKGEVPYAYKKDYEKMQVNPFAIFKSFYKFMFQNGQNVYSNLGMRYFGQEFNGRCLGAVYIKKNVEGMGSVWINLAKYIAYKYPKVEVLDLYTSSPEEEANFGYASNAFKLWTYDKDKQHYLDTFDEFFTKKGGDDRERIQKKINPLIDLDKISNYTAMIGDTLLTIPPTSIRIVNQTQSQRYSMIRSKGSMIKSLPKSERIIEMNLFFNGNNDINGYPVEWDLPNGDKVTYYMNGLRALISQFKFAPFLPIKNDYLNLVHNIEAVSLVSYQVTTVPNFPRTLQVTIKMQEFDYRQYMPELLPPDIKMDEQLTTNLFARTIHWPVLRYYYQRSIWNGEKLAELDYNSEEYIENTIGQRTALQRMVFDDPLIDFYIANEEDLKKKKQLKINLESRPMEDQIVFNETEKQFLFRLGKYYASVQKALNDCYEPIDKINKMSTDSNTFSYANVGKQNDQNLKDMAGHNLFAFVSGPLSFDRGGIISDTMNKVADTLTGVLAGHNDTNLSFVQEAKAITREDIIDTSNENDNYKITWGLDMNIDWSESGSENLLKKVKKYTSQKLKLTEDDIFKDGHIFIGYSATFSSKPGKNTNWKPMLDKFKKDSSGDFGTLGFIASMFNIQTDDKGNITNEDSLNGDDIFIQDEELNDMKDNIDLESAKTVKFDKYPVGVPIVTNINFTYNNLFNNISLKAVDGYAAQYTGGSDTVIEITMTTQDEFTVSQLQLLPKICTRRIIDYRKIMTCSPLRINCDIAQFMGINEVIIESVETDTVPNYPGLYQINMRLTSVDRTLRNKEALKKLDTKNEHDRFDKNVRMKNYFDFNDTLAKVELYPDLELPTLEELEKKGFYYIRYKNKGNRIYPDADFYFVYLHAYSSQMFRDSIIKYFNTDDYKKIKKSLMDSLGGNTAETTIDLKDKENPIKDWTLGDNGSFEKVKKSYVEQAQDLLIGNTGIDKSTLKYVEDDYAETLVQSEILSELKEVLNNAEYNNYTFCLDTKISVSKILPYGKSIKRCDNKEATFYNDKGEYVTQKTDQATNKMQETLRAIILKILSKPIPGDKDNSRLDGGTMMRVKNAFCHSDYDEFWKYLYFEIAKITGEKSNKDKSINDIWSLKVEFEGMDGVNMTTGPQAYFTKLIEGLASAATGKIGKLNSKEDDDWKGRAKIKRTDTDGKSKEYDNIRYVKDGQGVSTQVLAVTEEEKEKAIIFGAFGIRKYSLSIQSMIYDTKFIEGDIGFLDPYYNKVLTKFILKKEVSDSEMNERIKNYREKLMDDDILKGYGAHAIFRNMLVWLYKILGQEHKGFVPMSIFMLSNVETYINDLDKGQDGFLADTGEWFQKKYYGLRSWTESKDWGIFGDKDEKASKSFEIKKEALEKEDEVEDKVADVIKDLKENSKKDEVVIINGMFFALGILALTDFQTPVFQSVLSGNMGPTIDYLGGIRESFIDTNSTGNNTYKAMVSRLAQVIDYDFQKDQTKTASYKDPMNKYTSGATNNRVYLAMADEPSIYLVHSFYDMVLHDMRGRMARAFPTYYMLLVDEGRHIGLWRLQDNFYDVSSIVEFQVVKSRKIAADTASISMTNLFGTFTTDDEDIKDNHEYTAKDVFDSLFSPRSYYKSEFERRDTARELNRANLKPGARVHLRAGYEADASTLPILFNGVVAEVVPGDMMNIICQGDGIELSNPSMFNPTDAQDVADIENNDNIFSGLFDAFTNKSTPRDILINPLVAKGDFLKEMIRKFSNSRFFSANPFGIVHFGDKEVKDIFTQNGEVEQNIYEAISKPAWSSGFSLNNIETEYALEEAPEIRVGIQGNRSYWDLMHIAQSVSPDFICGIAPYQLRSTIFYGHPRYYYAYEYEKSPLGGIREKRKPFQQYHLYTSYTDIIGNQIKASSTQVRTNAMGIYRGPKLISEEIKTVGPLYVDIDIYPEFQKSTTIDCGFEYKATNFPITIPIYDWVKNELDENGGYQIAWRATAMGLLESIKDMYTGELIVIGDPTVKPHDRMYLYDTYEDMQGLMGVEQVVHTFSADTGYVTSITPDCISAIDDKHEKIASTAIKDSMLPALANFTVMAVMANKFSNITRGLFFSAAKTINLGEGYAKKAVNSLGELIGKEDLVAYKGLSDKYLGKLGTMFGVTQLDYNIYSSVSSLQKAYNSIPKPRSFSGNSSLMSFLDDLAEHPENMKGLGKTDDLIKQLEEAKKVEKNSKKLKEIENALDDAKKLNVDYTDAMKMMNDNWNISSKELDDILKHASSSIKDLDNADDIKDTIDALRKNYVATGKGISYADDAKDFSKAIKELKVATSKVTDFSNKGFLKVLDDIDLRTFKKSRDALDGFKDVKNVFKSVNIIKKGGRVASILASGGLSLLWIGAEWVITRSVQEWFERKLKNLQVLTVFPIMKNNRVMTAGMNGTQGAVFGSPTYNQPGFLENMASWFFDKHSGAMGHGMDFLRDMFLTTPEMLETVNKYKRDNVTVVQNTEEANLAAQTALLQSLVSNEARGYDAYKQAMLVPRVEDTKSDPAKVAFFKNKIVDVNDITVDKKIMDNLVYIFQTDVGKLLHEKGVLKFSAEADIKANSQQATIKSRVITTPTQAEGNGVQYAAKTILYEKKEQGNGKLPVYDIPYLRPDAIIVLDRILKEVAQTLQPDYKSENSDFNKLHKHNIVIQNATRVNEEKSWYSTGYLFTIEVKNSDTLRNILEKLNQEQSSSVSKLFSYKQDTTMSANTYNIFVAPRT